jgi:hypothetical protein
MHDHDHPNIIPVAVQCQRGAFEKLGPDSPACVLGSWNRQRRHGPSYGNVSYPRTAPTAYATPIAVEETLSKQRLETHLRTTEHPSQNRLTLLRTFIPRTCMLPLPLPDRPSASAGVTPPILGTTGRVVEARTESVRDAVRADLDLRAGGSTEHLSGVEGVVNGLEGARPARAHDEQERVEDGPARGVEAVGLRRRMAENMVGSDPW